MRQLERFSFETLEFRKSLETFQRFLRTPLSKPLLYDSKPTIDIEVLQTRFDELASARGILELGHVLPFDGIHDIHPILKRVEIPGTSCEGAELVRVLTTLQGIQTLRKSLENLTCPLGPLESYLHGLIPLDDLQKRLAECLEEDGTIKDAASPTLKKLRKQIRHQRGFIQKRLEEMCRRTEIRAVLQEEYFTERQGRYVLPVQSNQKRKIGGLQHGKSDSGTTAYIEPFELVDAGNDLAEAIDEERHEIVKILRELTDLVREELDILRATLSTVAELDLIVGLADRSLEMGADLPRIVEEGNLELRDMRHPLLLEQMEKKDVVPNDLLLDSDLAGLLITGPNTGGKTIVLKTAGLLCVMALSGLPIPCGKGTRIPLMGGVLADIGDDQSIEESLSTFSAHVSRMKAFLDVAALIETEKGHRALIILDELGAGTDPSEGSALGRALLEELIERNAWALVATHLGDLKVFGFSNDKLASGAMRFDGEALSPTYELLMDSIGESHGLEIAERLGLPENVVKRAQELLAENPNQSVSILHRLTEEEKRARELREDIDAIKQEIEEKRAMLVEKIEKTAREERRILSGAKNEAESKIQSAKRRLAGIEELMERKEQKLREGFNERENSIEEREKEIAWMERELDRCYQILSKMGERFPNFAPDLLKPSQNDRKRLARLSEPEWRHILERINEEETQVKKDFQIPAGTVAMQEDFRPPWGEIGVGDTIKVEGINNPVQVEEKDEKRKRLAILVGNLRSEIAYEKVQQRIAGRSLKPPRPKKGLVSSTISKADIRSEINLIGMRYEQMEEALSKYLDDALLAGWEEVRIIHGHGAGILRSGVREILHKHSHVGDFHEASASEGGGGATVAKLRG